MKDDGLKCTTHSRVVRVYFQDTPMGFYRASNIDHDALFLKHGPVVFPEGSEVTVQYFDRAKQTWLGFKATVLDKDDNGMRLQFDYTAEQSSPDRYMVVEWELPRH